MDTNDLVAAVANQSALSIGEAANAVDFVFHVMKTEQSYRDPADPTPMDTIARVVPEAAQFSETCGSAQTEPNDSL